MYKGKRILGIIPARGGSKGLKNKNILPLLGKPLVCWSIEQAMNSRLLDKVLVSTDSEQIASIAREAGADVPFLRPSHLAADDSPTFDTIAYTVGCLEDMGFECDLVALLEPTSPLRKDDDVDNAIKSLVDSKILATSLVSVGKVTLEHPAIMKKISNGYVIPYSNDKKVWQRQQLDDVLFPYGVIYLSYTKNLLRAKTFYQKKTIPYFIERWQNYEIDDFCDLLAVEAVMRLQMEQRKEV